MLAGVGAVVHDEAMSRSRGCCGFVPPYLLDRLGWQRTLQLDTGLRERRAASAAGAAAPRPAGVGEEVVWTVHTAAGTTDLPGELVRADGDPASDDPAVDEAAAGISGALALFAEVYDRDSFDGAGAPVVLTVHYGRDYANAFWDGTQLVFGDGDGEVFGRFTRSPDVLAHELTHAVTERTAGLVYEGQSGALNESVSDVFAVCAEQRLLGQTAAEADWLVGSALFLPGVRARGLRDMAAPGTAYDDPRLGRDPQPAQMADYVETTDDNGGVHLNSGIPNRAFQLAATGIGGTSWEGAGRIWYAALTGGQVCGRTDFAGFAAATIAAAGVHADVVRQAWASVGVEPVEGSVGAPLGPEPATAGRGTVRVRRTGGFAGRSVEGEVALDGEAEPATSLRALLARIDLAQVRSAMPSQARPDHFTYAFDLAGAHGEVHEQDLTDDLRAVADLVLRPPHA